MSSSSIASPGLQSFAFGPFVLVPKRQLLLENGAPVRIGSRALDILTVLVSRQGETVDKAQLIALVWPSTVVEESNLKVNMVALRKLLGERAGGAFVYRDDQRKRLQVHCSCEDFGIARVSVKFRTACPIPQEPASDDQGNRRARRRDR